MKKLTLEQQEGYLRVLEQHEPQLLAIDGVKDVAIGYPSRNGNTNFDEIAILVYVVKKFGEEVLSKEQLIPKSFNGIPVDVVESHPEEEEVTHPILLGGIGISNANLAGRGTLGIIVKDQVSEELWGLTNWHVIKRKRGKAGDPIVQPAWKPNNQQYRIGTLLKWDEDLDCAVFKLDTTRQIEAFQLSQVAGKIEEMTIPLMGTEVQKSGARTGITYGVISGVKRLNVEISPNPNKLASGGEISRAGDSGALWITDEKVPKAVALHRAGEKKGSSRERAYARDINTIAKKLGFQFSLAT
ncbi:trypsin-like peptidase domain-containing protein [Hymenobacter tenuis]